MQTQIDRLLKKKKEKKLLSPPFPKWFQARKRNTKKKIN